MEELKWFIECIAKAMRSITEDERYMLMELSHDEEKYFHLCMEHIGIRRTVSTILQKVHKEPSYFYIDLFNPINGKTTPVILCGDIDFDVPGTLEIIPDDAELRRRMMHDAQQEAVNWLIDYNTGKVSTKDSEKYIQQFAWEMEQDTNYRIVKVDGCKRTGKVISAWLYEGILNALHRITEEERNMLIKPSITDPAHMRSEPKKSLTVIFLIGNTSLIGVLLIRHAITAIARKPN